MSTTNKPQVSIRFKDREQLDLIKRAAAHRLIPFNSFVRHAAELVALSALETPPGIDFIVYAPSNAPSIPSSIPPGNAPDTSTGK